VVFRSDKPAASRKIHMSGNVWETQLISFARGYAQRSTYDQRQCPPALGIDKEQRRDGEDDLNGAVAQRCVQGLCV